MKLPTKKKYFDQIKAGVKRQEYRDAHITFVCEETGETIKKEIMDADVFKRKKDLYPDVLEDDRVIMFTLR